MPARRELGFGAARERGNGAAAVGLVADEEDDIAAAERGLAHVARRRAGREPLVYLRLAEPERGGGLPRAEQRARDHRIGRDAAIAQAPAELPRVLATVRSERPQRVGISGRRLSVTDDQETHCDSEYAGYAGGVAGYRYVVCDVFTEKPLAGNQLAVFTDAREIPEEQLQPLAREINFSETTFVYPADRDGHARVRFFTPRAELPFAGHPTLGTAFVLAAPLQLGEIRLETGAGTVPVRLERDGARIVFGRMEQPLPTIASFASTEELLAVLGVEPQLPVELYDNGIRHVFVAVGSRDEVARLRPDLQRLATLGALGINCFAGEGARWKTRMFAPGVGVPEDPATGSAAGPLALHLARHGRISFGEEVEISQGAELDRPSTLYARVQGSADAVERIEVGGAAVVVARGEFRV